MKKTMLFLSFLIITSGVLPAKSQVADTLAYLQNIVANKSSHIGKPFSQLENSMKIKFVSFFPVPGNYSDISKETSTFFFFLRPVVLEDCDSPSIIIDWYPSLNIKLSDAIFGKDRGGWSSEASLLYSTAIIKDIKIFGTGSRLTAD